MNNVYDLADHMVGSNKVPKKVTKSKSSDGGGGNDMSEYVTKEEFNLAIKDLTHQIELNQEKTNSKLVLISEKLDNAGNNISDKIQISLDAKDKEDKKDSRETRRYIIGTVVLGSLGIFIAIVSLFI